MNGQSPTQFTALASHYDELMQVVPYESWAEYVLLLCDVVEHVPRVVLDCACGTGNLTFELAKSDLSVTGVDIAAGMIEIARRKASGQAGNVRFFEADLTEFDLGVRFDTATCLYDSLNYILAPDKLEAAFRSIGHHVVPGGYFIFDMNTPHALTTDLFTQFNHDPRKQLHYDWNAVHDPQTQITSVDMLFTRHEADGSTTEFTEIHRERAYPMQDVLNLLERTGWMVEKVFDAYTLNRPHDRSERWFFVARKLVAVETD